MIVFANGMQNMTNYEGALGLLNDLEEFADTHEFPEAEKLIARARQAIEQELGGTFPPSSKSTKTSRVYIIQ